MMSIISDAGHVSLGTQNHLAGLVSINVLCEVGLQDMAVPLDHEVVKVKIAKLLQATFYFTGEVKIFATSRRLAWLITSLHLEQVEQEQQLKKLSKVLHTIIDQVLNFDFKMFAKWLCILIEQQVLPLTKWDLASSNVTYDLYGQPLILTHALAYESLLEKHHIIPCYAKRQQMVSEAIEPYLAQFLPIMRPHTLAVMVQTLESVHVVECQFDLKFLVCPELSLYFTELILAKKPCCIFFKNKGDGVLSNRFIALVSTLTPAATVTFYWNKAINNLLSSIDYFYHLDGPTVSLEGLKNLVISPALGTAYDQIMRFRVCLIGWALHFTALNLSAMLAACNFMRVDSLKQIVNKYPQLAFLMSAHYARINGASDEVVNIIKSLSPYPQYSILTQEAALLSLLYHLDFIMSTHVSFHSIQDFSLGSDPFEVRRYTQKIMQLLEHLDVSLMHGIQLLLGSYGEQYAHYSSFFYDFFLQRLSNYCQHQHILPALSKSSLNLYQIQKHHAYFQQHPMLLQQIMQMQKRINKILAKQMTSESGITLSSLDRFELLLHDQSLVFAQMNFASALAHLQDFLQDLNRFFRHYLIHDPRPQVKSNRIMILKQVSHGLAYLLAEAQIF